MLLHPEGGNGEGQVGEEKGEEESVEGNQKRGKEEREGRRGREGGWIEGNQLLNHPLSWDLS